MKCLEKYGIYGLDEKLLLEALTHSSYKNEHKNCRDYERLEFLGDAVLELISSEYFYKKSQDQEGKLTKKRAVYVCEQALAQYVKDVGYEHYIRAGHGQQDDVNDTIIADTFESVLGVIYLCKGLEVAREYVLKVMTPYVEKNYLFLDDYKTVLQELVQTDRKSLEYELVRESGFAHDKTFEYVVKIDNIIYGRGIGKSKKEAEQNAAKEAYNKSAM